jgi:hypothetical protein
MNYILYCVSKSSVTKHLFRMRSCQEVILMTITVMTTRLNKIAQKFHQYKGFTSKTFVSGKIIDASVVLG